MALKSILQAIKCDKLNLQKYAIKSLQAMIYPDNNLHATILLISSNINKAKFQRKKAFYDAQAKIDTK